MVSRLTQMQARFQQRQMQEKEEKLVKLYENQQQRAFERVGRGSAGSNDSLTNASISTGKVRQMFDERRQKAGIDRSYPLEPLAKARPTKLNKGSPPKGLSVRNKLEKLDTGDKKLVNNNNRDEAEQYLEDHADLVRLMNKHNLQDNLEDEEMPRISFDELGYDEEIFSGKLANVGGKLPSQANNASPGGSGSVQTKAIGRPGQRQPVTQSRGRVAPPAVEQRVVKSSPTSKRSNNNTKSESSLLGNISKQPSPAESPSKMRSQKQNGDSQQNSSPSRPPLRTSLIRPMVQRDDLVVCTYCQRRFATDRIQTHEDICSRTAKKKRKVYDSTKHRVAGTEVEQFSKKSSKIMKSTKSKENMKRKGETKPTSKTNWRQKHEEFISCIRAAKEAQAFVEAGGNLKDLPPPPPSSNPDYIQCPHCGRSFNQQAAERHIPKCATYQFNKPRK